MNIRPAGAEFSADGRT